MKRHLFLAATFGIVALLGPVGPATAQLGGAGRKVGYFLSDNVYSPKTTLKVRKGETITFTFVNKGKVIHEALVGTPAAQAMHEKEMAKMGAMSMKDEAISCP